MMLVYFLVPSQKPVPASKSLGSKKRSWTRGELISYGDTIGTTIAKRINNPKINAPTTDDLFFLNLFYQELSP